MSSNQIVPLPDEPRQQFDLPIYEPNAQALSGLKYLRPNITLWELCSILGPDYIADVEDTTTGLTRQMNLESLLNEWAIEPLKRRSNLFCKIDINDTPMKPCYKPPTIIDTIAGGLCGDIKDERLFYSIQKGVRFDHKADFDCTWMFILSGEFRLSVYNPTEHNKMMHLLLSTGEFGKKRIHDTRDPEFVMEADSGMDFSLTAETFVAIPTGWIYTFEALDDGYIFGGHFLNKDNIDFQIGWLGERLGIALTNGDIEIVDHIKLLIKRLVTRKIRKGRSKLDENDWG